MDNFLWDRKLIFQLHKQYNNKFVKSDSQSYLIYTFTSCTNCKAFNIQICRHHRVRIWVSGLKSDKTSWPHVTFHASFHFIFHFILKNNEILHLKVLLYLACDWYLPDCHKLKGKMRLSVSFNTYQDICVTISHLLDHSMPLFYLLTPVFHCHLNLLDMVDNAVDPWWRTVEQSTGATSTRANSLKIYLILRQIKQHTVSKRPTTSTIHTLYIKY